MNWKTTQHNLVQIAQLTKLHLFLCVFIYSFFLLPRVLLHKACIYNYIQINTLKGWVGVSVNSKTLPIFSPILSLFRYFWTLCAWRCFPSAARETSTNDSACGTKKHILVVATFNPPGRVRWTLRPSWQGGCSISGWSTARPPHLTWRPRLKQSLFCCL